MINTMAKSEGLKYVALPLKRLANRVPPPSVLAGRSFFERKEMIGT